LLAPREPTGPYAGTANCPRSSAEMAGIRIRIQDGDKFTDGGGTQWVVCKLGPGHTVYAGAAPANWLAKLPGKEKDVIGTHPARLEGKLRFPNGLIDAADLPPTI
jgi:hypothetical protein